MKPTAGDPSSAVFVVDFSGNVISVEGDVETVFEWPIAELVGRPLADSLAPAAHRETWFDTVAGRRSAPGAIPPSRHAVLVARKPSGSEFPVAVSCVEAVGLDQTTVTVMRLGPASDPSAGLFRLAFEAAPAGMVIVEADGTVSQVNALIEQVFGWSRDELVGKPVEILIPERLRDRHREDRTLYAAAPQRRAMGAGNVLFARRRDGSEFPVEIGLNPTVEGGRVRVLVAIVDISERHRTEAESERYRRELERANLDLDQFAHAASHDLRAPLRAIRSLAEWIGEDLGSEVPAAVGKHLATMKARATRLDRLVTDLLAYARAGREPVPIERVDTSELVREAIADLAPRDGLTTVVAAGLPVLDAPPAPLAQVLRNLIENAYKHHDRDQGRVEVSCAAHGGMVEFRIRDDGPGIRERDRERIFEPFQTLRPRDEVEGSGLGLALVRKIVERHGGTIHVEPSPGRGATFVFTWPERVAREDARA